jgi:hypothetical protein
MRLMSPSMAAWKTLCNPMRRVRLENNHKQIRVNRVFYYLEMKAWGSAGARGPQVPEKENA